MTKSKQALHRHSVQIVYKKMSNFTKIIKGKNIK